MIEFSDQLSQIIGI